MPHSSFQLLNYRKPILVFGRDGQVGKALQVYLKNSQAPIIFLGRNNCDLSNELSIMEVLDSYKPQVIINAAAYTAVDKAEIERELAFSINAKAPEIMARYIANLASGVLVHYSTDYVFLDTKKTAYLESDTPGPSNLLSIYGQSKLAGEKIIEEIFNVSPQIGHKNNSPKYYILRGSWIYGDGDNFIKKILYLADQKDSIKVAQDRIGVPTSAQWLAEISIHLAESRAASGIYHAVPDGEISLHELAVFVVETANLVGKVFKINSKNILPVPAVECVLVAKRPYNSRLSNLKLKKILSEIEFIFSYPHWQKNVQVYVKDYVNTSLESQQIN